MSRIRAVLLDAMGTLVELEPPAPRLAAELEARCGARPTLAQAEAAFAAEVRYYRAQMARGTRAGLPALWRDCARELRAALPPAFQALALADVEAALHASLRFRAHADAVPALRELRASGRRLVVCSNWDASLPDVLAGCGLGPELLDAVVASAAAGAAKPDGAMFAAALAAAGVAADGALHVGDDLAADVEGARAAAIAPVWLRRDGAGSQPPPRAVPVIATLAQLPELLATYP